MYAAYNGHLEIVRELLKQGANKALKDKYSGQTAYDKAKKLEIKALLR